MRSDPTTLARRWEISRTVWVPFRAVMAAMMASSLSASMLLVASSKI